MWYPRVHLVWFNCFELSRLSSSDRLPPDRLITAPQPDPVSFFFLPTRPQKMPQDARVLECIKLITLLLLSGIYRLPLQRTEEIFLLDLLPCSTKPGPSSRSPCLPGSEQMTKWVLSTNHKRIKSPLLKWYIGAATPRRL